MEIAQFLETRISTQHSLGWVEESLHAKSRFVQSFRYNTGLWRTDGRTDEYKTTAYTALARSRTVKNDS